MTQPSNVIIHIPLLPCLCIGQDIIHIDHLPTSGLLLSTVKVSVRQSGGKVLICCKNNGTGTPKNVLDKIFQPFFATKPTGQGIGLSLSYNIIKAHVGELKAETKECESAEFIVSLPLNAS